MLQLILQAADLLMPEDEGQIAQRVEGSIRFVGWGELGPMMKNQ